MNHDDQSSCPAQLICNRPPSSRRCRDSSATEPAPVANASSRASCPASTGSDSTGGIGHPESPGSAPRGTARSRDYDRARERPAPRIRLLTRDARAPFRAGTRRLVSGPSARRWGGREARRAATERRAGPHEHASRARTRSPLWPSPSCPSPPPFSVRWGRQTPSARATAGHLGACRPSRRRSLWYTPLLLTRQEPESVSVRVPVLASTGPRCTARAADDGHCDRSCPGGTRRRAHGQPRDGDLLTVMRRRRRASASSTFLGSYDRPLHAHIGSGSPTRAGPSKAAPNRCIAHRRTSIRMPVVFGLFSGARSTVGRGPDDRRHDRRTRHEDDVRARRSPGSWQLLALARRSAPRSPLRPGRATAGSRGCEDRARWVQRGSSHLVDAVVVVMLAGWWIVAPVMWDDGWIVARERTFSGVWWILDLLRRVRSQSPARLLGRVAPSLGGRADERRPRPAVPLHSWPS